MSDLDRIDLDKVPSATLRRLIEEVRCEEINPPGCYDRYHNRHNRSMIRPTTPLPAPPQIPPTPEPDPEPPPVVPITA